MKFIYWYTTRNGNDGRRPSGIGRTPSRIHRCETADSQRTLCGINLIDSAALYTKITDTPPDDNRQVCRRCEHKIAGVA